MTHVCPAYSFQIRLYTQSCYIGRVCKLQGPPSFRIYPTSTFRTHWNLVNGPQFAGGHYLSLLSRNSQYYSRELWRPDISTCGMVASGSVTPLEILNEWQYRQHMFRPQEGAKMVTHGNYLLTRLTHNCQLSVSTCVTTQSVSFTPI